MINCTQNEIEDLKWEQVDIKHNRRRAEERHQTRSAADPQGLASKLKAVRREKYDAQLKRSEAEMRDKNVLLERRTDLHRKDIDCLCDGVIKDLLLKVGRIEEDAAEPDAAQDNSNGLSPASGQIDPHRSSFARSAEVSDNLNSESDIEAAETTRYSDLSAEQLQNRYQELRSQLDEVRNDCDGKQRQLRKSKIFHLTTFTNSNQERFEEFVFSQVTQEAEAVGLTENKLIALRERIIRSGGTLPRSSPEDLSTALEAEV